jgi:hypothetical protein
MGDEKSDGEGGKGHSAGFGGACNDRGDGPTHQPTKLEALKGGTRRSPTGAPSGASGASGGIGDMGTGNKFGGDGRGNDE